MTDRIYSVKINLTVRGKNILIIQSKWNDYKIMAKSKSNTINLAEL